MENPEQTFYRSGRACNIHVVCCVYSLDGGDTATWTGPGKIR